MKEDQRSLLATSLAHFINDGLTGVLPLAYPVYLVTYGLSIQLVSIFTFLQNALSIVVSPVVGRISDVRGNFNGMLAMGLLIFAVGAAGYAVSGDFFEGSILVVVLLIFTLLVGVGSSFYHPLGATVLRAKWKESEIGRALGLNGSAGSIGRIAMPFAAALLITDFALSSVSLLAGFSVIGALAVFIVLRNVKFAAKPRTSVSLRDSLLPNRDLLRRMFPLTVVSFSRGLFTGVVPFIPLYLTQVDHVNDLTAGFLYSGTLGVGIISTIMFGFMQDRLGPKVSLTVSNLGGVLTLFIFAASSDPLVVDSAVVVFGLFSYSAFPLLLGLVHNMTDFDEMTSASSIVWGIGNNGGAAVAPLVIGALALPSVFGTLTAGFITAAAIGILSVILIPSVHSARRVSLVAPR
ncbi:MAG TPA: MFS transporter [Nitrososphaerales archaeon]|nr:MFS transporter [Nitrososphaerales archaeon]